MPKTVAQRDHLRPPLLTRRAKNQASGNDSGLLVPIGAQPTLKSRLSKAISAQVGGLYAPNDLPYADCDPLMISVPGVLIPLSVDT